MKNIIFIKFIKIIIFITFSFLPFTFYLPSRAFAQVTPAPLGNLEGLGPLGEVIKKLNASDVSPASNLLTKVISSMVGIITIVAGIWFLIQILIAGLNWIGSSGDKNKVLDAQHKITNSVVGLTIVVAAYAITNLIGKILGINILDIGAAIKLLGPK